MQENMLFGGYGPAEWALFAVSLTMIGVGLAALTWAILELRSQARAGDSQDEERDDAAG